MLVASQGDRLDLFIVQHNHVQWPINGALHLLHGLHHRDLALRDLANCFEVFGRDVLLERGRIRFHSVVESPEIGLDRIVLSCYLFFVHFPFPGIGNEWQ